MSLNFQSQLDFENWLERQDEDWVAMHTEEQLRDIFFNAGDELVESMVDDEINY